MDNNDSGAFFTGILLGVVVILLVIGASSTSPTNLYRKAIENCEKDLPRNKHCKVIGVIDESSEVQ
jgi:hypothetical protein